MLEWFMILFMALFPFSCTLHLAHYTSTLCHLYDLKNQKRKRASRLFYHDMSVFSAQNGFSFSEWLTGPTMALACARYLN